MVKHKMIISKATPEEYYSVRLFYHSLIDALEGTKYHPMWQKDIYPAPEELKSAIETAKDAGMKAIRLDVLKGNVPAERLYTSIGFVYVDTLKLFYEDTGRVDFELYELRV